MNTEEERRYVANYTFSYFAGLDGILSHWLYFLINPKYNSDDKIQENTTIILISALLDVVQEHSTNHGKMHENAIAVGSNACVYFLDQAEILASEIKGLLSYFSYEEFAYHRFRRNEVVHGNIGDWKRGSYRFKYVNSDSEFVVEEVDNAEIHQIHRDHIQEHKGAYFADRNLHTKLTATECRLWSMLLPFFDAKKSTAFRDKMLSQIHSHDDFNAADAVFDFSNVKDTFSILRMGSEFKFDS